MQTFLIRLFSLAFCHVFSLVEQSIFMVTNSFFKYPKEKITKATMIVDIIL
jgi:hypothetical protein